MCGMETGRMCASGGLRDGIGHKDLYSLGPLPDFTFSGAFVFGYYESLHVVHWHAENIVIAVISHLKSCSSCTLDATFGSSDHLPLVKYHLSALFSKPHDSSRIFPRFATLFVVVPNIAAQLTLSEKSLTLVPIIVISVYSTVGSLTFQRLCKVGIIVGEIC